jgi:hypothetical protein
MEMKMQSSQWVGKNLPRPKKHGWFLHYDSAQVHGSLLIHDFLANMNTTVLSQPPNSPHLAPADFFLFRKLKSTLKG